MNKKKKMVEQFFNMSLLGIVPILEAMDDWRVVNTLLKMFGDDKKIRLHLEKLYTKKEICYYESGKLNYEYWYLDGKPHRLDGPAIIHYFGYGKINYEAWYLNGKRNRIGGPAIIHYNQRTGKIYSERWYLDGKRHRLDGPADIEYYESGKIRHEEWFLDDNIIF